MKMTLKMFALILTVTAAFGQTEKIRARVSVQYTRIMGIESFISISAKYKGEDGYEPATGVEFHIYHRLSEDSLVRLGSATTNENGKAKFILTEERDAGPSKEDDFTFVIKIEANQTFSDAENELTVSGANLSASMETVDSVNQISATLTDASGQPLQGQSLRLQLQRMYAPLLIGEESYETDENGTITVPLEATMPGLDGILTFEVVLNESDDYGTVKALISAPIGIPVSDQSTFDKRTMWSPPSKTPGYLLLFPNLIILGVWIPILVLIFNLYRISKAKPRSL